MMFLLALINSLMVRFPRLFAAPAVQLPEDPPPPLVACQPPVVDPPPPLLVACQPPAVDPPPLLLVACQPPAALPPLEPHEEELFMQKYFIKGYFLFNYINITFF